MTPFRQQQQAKKIIFVFLVFTIISSLSAAAFVTGNAFAKKSNGGGGGSSKDKGGSGSSDNGGGGGSSDTSGGGGSENTGGKTTTGGSDTAGGSSDTGSTSTPPSTTEGTTEPPATEGSTPPPAENQQKTCPNGLTLDENGNCPESTSTTNTPAPVDCKATPTDPSCTSTANTTPAPVDCKATPTDPSCTSTANTIAPVDCKATPTDPSCTAAANTPPVKCAADEYYQPTAGVCFSAKVVNPDTHQCGIEGYHKISEGSCESDDTPLPSGGCVTGRHLHTSDLGTTGCLTDKFIDKPASGCPEDYGLTDWDNNLCAYRSIPIQGRCGPGWHFTDVVSKQECTQDTTPSTEISYTYVDVGQPLPSGACDKGTKIGDRCVLGAMDIGGAVLGKCSAGDKIGNRCIIIPAPVISMPKVLGHCPADYHDLEPGVSCAFDIHTQASTAATTQTGGTGTGTTTTTTPATTQTGNAKGTTTGTTTNTGGPTNTPGTTQQTGGTNNGAGVGTTTTTTTTSPTSTTSTTTSTTSVINRGGSSSGGGGTASGGSSGGGTGTAAPSQGANNFLTYVNSVNKITMKYPSSWTKTDLVGNPRIPVMFSAPTTIATATATPGIASTKTSFVISITPAAANLDTFTLQQLNTLTQSKAIKYTITSSDANVLTPPVGISAFREVSYDAIKNNNIPLKGAAIFFVNGGTGYSLLYLAKQTDYTQNIPMVQQMVNSFQIGGSAAAGAGSGGGPVQNVAAASSSPR